jgi:glycosyltransferase involved in cell wall biosynthesis
LRIAFLSIGRHLHTERWIRWFAERGDECHLLTVQPGPIDGVRVHDIRAGGGPKPWRYWRSLAVVRHLLDEIGPDLLNTHFLTGYGYWGDFSAFRPNVLTVWGDDVYVTPHENVLKNWLARRALRHADFVTGDSADILRECTRLGAAADRCYEVLWGVDFEAFRPDRSSPVRARLGIDEDAVVLFSPRSFTQPYYNLDTIIAATARVHREDPRVHVVFAGYEGDQTPFEALARDAGLRERTHFVGRIPHGEFGAWLAASDVFISVPSVDATAVSLLEAMACGRAVVVSDLPSSTEWVRSEQEGLVVPPRDEDALVGALTRLVRDESLRSRLGEAALREVRRHADFDQNMQRVLALFEACRAATPPPRVDMPQLLTTEGGLR